MYLESIEYVVEQVDDFCYYGEILSLLENIIPKVNKKIINNK
jgi:hypothetical protein